MNIKLFSQIKEALKNAAAQIEYLRRENEILRVKAECFETMQRLISITGGNRGAIYSTENMPDGAAILRNLLSNLEEQEKKEQEEAARSVRKPIERHLEARVAKHGNNAAERADFTGKP